MRPPTLQSARKRAWKAFSRWVIDRDKRCITCGSTHNLQAGHFHHAVLDFDEINVNAQCARCNKWLHGNLSDYSAYLVEKYGVKEFFALNHRHWLAMRGEKRSIEDYLEIEKKYSSLQSQIG